MSIIRRNNCFLRQTSSSSSWNNSTNIIVVRQQQHLGRWNHIINHHSLLLQQRHQQQQPKSQRIIRCRQFFFSSSSSSSRCCSSYCCSMYHDHSGETTSSSNVVEEGRNKNLQGRRRRIRNYYSTPEAVAPLSSIIQPNNPSSRSYGGVTYNNNSNNYLLQHYQRRQKQKTARAFGCYGATTTASSALVRTFSSSSNVAATAADDDDDDNSGLLLRHTSNNPKDTWRIHPDLVPHTRASLSSSISDDENDDDTNDTTTDSSSSSSSRTSTTSQYDTGFSYVLLGTGAGKPSLFQGNAAGALRMGSTTYLFDAGEGIQLQLMRSKLKMSNIRKIFITHLHGDHIFGLPGLLLALQIGAVQATQPSSKRKRRRGRGRNNNNQQQQQDKILVQIYGPVGIYNYLAMSLSFSSTELKHMVVEVYEFQGGSKRWRHPGAMRNYKEFNHRGLVRKNIPQNDDGTWTVSTAREIETEEDALEYNSRPQGVSIMAAEIHHVPKLQCFGYVVSEPKTQPRNIDIDRAKELGVKPGSKYKLLKSGFPVTSDDGTREVQPDEVLVGDAAPAPRSMALLGDCCNVPDPMRQLCQNVDVLVHEATISSESETGNKVDFGGHSTPAMAGQFASDVNAKVLILNHLSPMARFRPVERALVREAENSIRNGRTRVQVGYDHLELLVPREGFPA